MAIIPVRDEAHWHELRAKHIGGSDSAAILGVSPYKTKWQLWMEKAGRLSPEDLSNNKAVQAGTFLESGIANWAAHRWGMPMEKITHYYSVDDTPGMGASFDYATKEGYPVEIKWSANAHGWTYDNDQILEAPDQYIIQVQHQIACVDAPHGWLIALIHNEPRRLFVPRHEGIIDAIKTGVVQFWSSIRDNVEPEVDFSLDAEAIDRMMEKIPLTDVDLDAEHTALFEKYIQCNADIKKAEADKDAAKAELLVLAKARMEGTNTPLERAIVRCGERKMSITTVKPNLGVEVTQDMVGTRIKTRRGYQLVLIS